MHIFFSGIGGTAIGPLALISQQAGYTVSGSDKQDSNYIDHLRNKGLTDIRIGQTQENIAHVHAQNPIDWFVYSSAVTMEQPNSEELVFCKMAKIKATKRDEFLNHLIFKSGQKLIAIAGTHGKTTTAAMTVWLFKELGIPLSYSVGAKLPFGDMGSFDPEAEFFALEADEFDHNFLSFEPFLALITGIDYDHHEIYPTRQNYEHAFVKFIRQSMHTVLWREDAAKLELKQTKSVDIIQPPRKNPYRLVGEVNRSNAQLVVDGLYSKKIIQRPQNELIQIMNQFPGLSRRFERIVDGLYSDYAHTPEKIRGCLKTAFELSQNVVVVHEPLTNRRQHFILDEYKDLFLNVKKLYWVPSYLAREDPRQHILTPDELIKRMSNKEIAEASLLDDTLKDQIQEHVAAGDLVVCISGGGGGSLDEWVRRNYAD